MIRCHQRWARRVPGWAGSWTWSRGSGDTAMSWDDGVDPGSEVGLTGSRSGSVGWGIGPGGLGVRGGSSSRMASWRSSIRPWRSWAICSALARRARSMASSCSSSATRSTAAGRCSCAAGGSSSCVGVPGRYPRARRSGIGMRHCPSELLYALGRSPAARRRFKVERETSQCVAASVSVHAGRVLMPRSVRAGPWPSRRAGKRRSP